jgi:hypothetical protein
MKTLREFQKPISWTIVGLALVVVALGIALWPAPQAEALAPPGPQCGPSYLWICSGPGGPDILFGGTICEKNEFEKENGVTCVPF